MQAAALPKLANVMSLIHSLGASKPDDGVLFALSTAIVTFTEKQKIEDLTTSVNAFKIASQPKPESGCSFSFWPKKKGGLERELSTALDSLLTTLSA